MNVLFNVHYDMQPDELQGKNVLVFLAPPPPSRNITGLAWRVLTASAGAVESFQMNDVVSVAVAGRDADGKPVNSEKVTVQPGQLFWATNPDSQALKLAPGPDALAHDRLLPRQYGLTNRTDPGLQLDCTWYMADAPALTMPAVDSGMTTTFDGSQSLYFVVAEAPQVGEGMAQAFSDAAMYMIPANVSEVNVSLKRKRGMWVFDFGIV